MLQSVFIAKRLKRIVNDKTIRVHLERMLCRVDIAYNGLQTFEKTEVLWFFQLFKFTFDKWHMKRNMLNANNARWLIQSATT